jgi:alkanesulfonate monooxygenase SsuD/methylene tetrahydromethanopterin reductase-like flavin-dependent oxidoreductase (luciferase family)
MMQFGLLYECQRPFQGTTIDWNALYKETLAQCELADQVGFNNLWFVEHHFLTGFSGSPSQDALFGALSRITKQIRIGYGVCILPYHHPVRVAERVAILDQLTDGRIELGTGRSNAYEQTGLGVDPRDTRSLWDESITMLPKIWTSDEFEWKGPHWTVPKRRVLPKPYQQPHPRMYLACTSPDSFRRRRRGLECCRRRPMPSMSWPISSRSTARPSRQPSRWARSSQTSGATMSTPSAMTMTSTPRTSPPSP